MSREEGGIKMGFLDLIKKSVVAEFSNSLSTVDVFFSLLIAFLAAIIIITIYKKTYTGVSYTKSFALSIVLLAMVTSLVIRTINSNLALSLGMVGALSIVRFRTAVKDPVDTIFMFWAITAGIMAGAGLYLITLIATLILGILYVVSYTTTFKASKKYLLVIKATKEAAPAIIKIMGKKKKCVLKTESYKKNKAELTFELASRGTTEDIMKLQSMEEIESLHLINID